MRLPDKVREAIKPFQSEGVAFLKDKTNALLADEMGTGKTLQALCAMHQAPNVKALILCPASVKYNWAREVKEWGFPYTTQVVESAKCEIADKDITIINYDQIIKKQRRFELFIRQWTHLVADESHMLKNYQAKRTEAVLGAYGIKNKAARRWMMTGTPVLNRPIELYPVLKALVPDRLGKYVRWIAYAKRYCEGREGMWGFDVSGADNLEELAVMLDGFMLRRLKKDIMSQLPDKVFEKILINSSKKCEVDVTDNTLRQDVGMAKVTATVDHVKNILEEKDKVVVFGYHRAVLEELRNKLARYNPVLVYGGGTARDKDDAVQRFINDPSCKVFIGNILAAGTGVNGLQKVTDTAVFIELVYTPGTMYQACDRLHREGQKDSVLIQFMVIANSVDEEMLDAIIKKEKVIHKITRDDKDTLRFTIQNEKTTRRKSMADKLSEVFDAFLEALAERVASKIKGCKMEPVPQFEEVPVPEPVEEPAEPVEEPAAKAVKKTKKKAEPEPAEKFVCSPIDVETVRGAMRTFLNPLVKPEDQAKKKAMTEAVKKRILTEIGQLATEGLHPKQCRAYIAILAEEFVNQFGGDAWQSIAP